MSDFPQIVQIYTKFIWVWGFWQNQSPLINVHEILKKKPLEY
jgi:hypothetical protein